MLVLEEEIFVWIYICDWMGFKWNIWNKILIVYNVLIKCFIVFERVFIDLRYIWDLRFSFLFVYFDVVNISSFD